MFLEPYSDIISIDELFHRLAEVGIGNENPAINWPVMEALLEETLPLPGTETAQDAAGTYNFLTV